MVQKSKCQETTAFLLVFAILFILAGCSGQSPPTKNSMGGSTISSSAAPSETDLQEKESPNTSADDGLPDVENKDENTGKDLVIPISDISETATFYPVEIDGTTLEVIAVKAPDSSIRTAFNTCQVCYDSGRGYYKQDGNVLVCQNCGNRFKMDQVETQSGGCNPVPIFPENKTVTDESITIPYDYLKEAKEIFANWKTEY